MTAKRFSVIEGECDVYDENYHNIVCRTDFKEDAINVCKLLNILNEENEQLKHRLAISEKANFVTALEKENEQLKTQLQNTSDQRNEFHRAVRENANRVGKLEKENEQLKHKLQQQELEYATTCNRLAEENEQLRKDSTVLILANQDYMKENEKLKKEVEDLKQALIRCAFDR